jgi:hypothetical protein
MVCVAGAHALLPGGPVDAEMVTTGAPVGIRLDPPGRITSLSDIAAFDTVTGRRNWARSGLCDCALSFTEAQKCKVSVVGNGPNSKQKHKNPIR